MTGVEPASEAWEASILPMNYIRMLQTIIVCNFLRLACAIEYANTYAYLALNNYINRALAV